MPLFDSLNPVLPSALPASLLNALKGEFDKSYWPKLQAFDAEERSNHAVFLLGQDLATRVGRYSGASD